MMQLSVKRPGHQIPSSKRNNNKKQNKEKWYPCNNKHEVIVDLTKNAKQAVVLITSTTATVISKQELTLINSLDC